MRTQLLAVLLLGSLAGTLAAQAGGRRSLQTIGADDVEAAQAVGQALVNHDIGAKKVAARIAKAKAHEAEQVYMADKKVARAVQHALKHAGGHAAQTAALAEGGVMPAAILSGLETAKVSVHDGKRISHAMARAQRIKAKAKAHTIKVVVKSIGEAAESDLAYGVKAAGLVGKAALHDFAPILAPVLGPKFLPQLASVASVGPAGLTNVLGGLASAIGGQLLGNDQIGVAGPALLASRVASLLPADLLSGFTEGLSGVGGGLSPAATGLDGLIQNIPPEALQAIVGFFSGGGAAPSTFRQPQQELPSLLPHLPNPLRAMDTLIHLPEHALQALMHAITNVLSGGRRDGPHLGPFRLPQLPAPGLPLPLKVLSNLLGVLAPQELQQVMRLLPGNQLFPLVGGLPLGLAEE